MTDTTFTEFIVAHRDDMPEAFQHPSQAEEEAVLYSKIRVSGYLVTRYWAWGLESNLQLLADALNKGEGVTV